MSDSQICFDLPNFLQFLQHFDPIAEKYRATGLFKSPKSSKGKDVEFKVSSGTLGGVSPMVLTHLENLEEYDALYRLQIRSSKKYSDIWEDLCQIYGYYEPITDYLSIYTLTQDKLIGRFLAIPGLDKLYLSQYFRFEWRMHLNLDFDHHQPSYYRDHFIHQAKDAYMIYSFLIHMGFMDAIKRILNHSSAPAVQFFKTSIAKARQETLSNDTLNVLMKEQFWICYHPDSSSEENPLKCITSIKNDSNEYLNYLDDCNTERLLLSVSFLAGLFHDLGYPLAFSMDSIEDMGDFLPISHYFFQGTESFTRINAVLINSMLFSLVSSREIEKRFLQRDHGTLSALAFLLYFYENGSVFTLNALERAAIELAAIIIYDHTLSYNNQAKSIDNLLELGVSTCAGSVLNSVVAARDNPYYRPSAYVTPLSYLFRLCDDLQEWDRIYFYLSTSHNLRICRKCGMPIVNIPVVHPDTERTDTEKGRSICGCSKNPSEDTLRLQENRDSVQAIGYSTPVEYTASNIDYRKLFHIKTCQQVIINRIVDIDSTVKDPPTLGYIVDVQYDPFKLLQMCQIDPEFAPHRAKELRHLRERLADQWGIPNIVVNAFITNNPLLLKLRMIENFLVYASEHTPSHKDPLIDGCFYWGLSFHNEVNDLLKRVVNASLTGNGTVQRWKEIEKKLNDIFLKLITVFSDNKPNLTNEHLRVRFRFYAKLTILCWRLRAKQIQYSDYLKSKKSSAPRYNMWRDIISFVDCYSSSMLKTDMVGYDYGNTFEVLLDDCLYQNAVCDVSPYRRVSTKADKVAEQYEYAKAFDYTEYLQEKKPFPEGYMKQFELEKSNIDTDEQMKEIVISYSSPWAYQPDKSPLNEKEPIDFYTDLYFFCMMANSSGGSIGTD